MATGFAHIPDARRFVLARATVPATLADLRDEGDGLATVDITIADGRIARIDPAGGAPAEVTARVDLDRGMVLPGLVDVHTHLDKGHIWPRCPNPDGTFPSALDAVERDREANWSADDVRARMDFSLRCAHAHGTVAIRTHLDSLGPQTAISWPVFDEMRAEWRDRITLQAVSLFAIDRALDDDFLAGIVAAVRRHGGILGAVTFMIPELDRALDRLVRAASDHGLALDFHVDETGDPQARSLDAIARAVLRNHFEGPVLAGHCCSLAVQPPDTAAATVARVAEAGLSVVSLPMCNLYLQARSPGTTPRWRGVTALHELAAAGVPVMIASDNTRDPFYAYGDLDLVEVLRAGTRILHLDHPFGDAVRLVTSAPAAQMGLAERGRLAAGLPADLVLVRARSWTELLSRPQADRTVLRAGRPIDTTLPDYRELDDLMERRS